MKDVHDQPLNPRVKRFLIAHDLPLETLERVDGEVQRVEDGAGNPSMWTLVFGAWVLELWAEFAQVMSNYYRGEPYTGSKYDAGRFVSLLFLDVRRSQKEKFEDPGDAQERFDAWLEEKYPGEPRRRSEHA